MAPSGRSVLLVNVYNCAWLLQHLKFCVHDRTQYACTFGGRTSSDAVMLVLSIPIVGPLCDHV